MLYRRTGLWMERRMSGLGEGVGEWTRVGKELSDVVRCDYLEGKMSPWM